jgi:hypothetical protein
MFNKNQIKPIFFKKIIEIFYDKFSSIDLVKEYNDLCHNKINVDDNKLNSYKKILNENQYISQY